MKSALLFISVLLIFHWTHAQSAVLSAMQKIWQAYHPNRQIMFQSTIKVYSRDQQTNPDEVVTGRFVLEPGKFYCAVGMIEMLQNDRYYVSIDHSSKMIVAGKTGSPVARAQNILFTPGKLMELLKSGMYKASMQANGCLHELLLTPSGASENPAIRITFDSTSGCMSHTQIKYVHGGKYIEIMYTKPVYTKEGAGLFSQQKYFTIQNGRAALAQKYIGYQLIDQL